MSSPCTALDTTAAPALYTGILSVNSILSRSVAL